MLVYGHSGAPFVIYSRPPTSILHRINDYILHTLRFFIELKLGTNRYNTCSSLGYVITHKPTKVRAQNIKFLGVWD